MRPVPPDVTYRIAEILHDQGRIKTVGALRLLDRATSIRVDPVFFSTLVINGGVPKIAGKEWHVRRLVIQRFRDDIPSAMLPNFPRVHAVILAPLVTDSIRTWSDTDLPPILDWLTRICSPTTLHLRFPLVSSYEWAEYRDTSTRGQYQLVARLSRLSDPDLGLWGHCLEEVIVHDVVHQVLPSVKGVRNVYHFANHVAPASSYAHPNNAKRILPVGPESTGLPGPEWNYRAWQISTAVKHLFPSTPPPCSSSATSTSLPASTLDTTSWSFHNVAGHVLTKDDRDDEDDSGVEYTQVESLVRDLVENGLKLDLPAREGFEEGMLGRLFGQIRYLPEEGEQHDTGVHGHGDFKVYALHELPT